jgi:ribosome biogenesis GTPase A
MQIHWYPGHMHKAQRKMREIFNQVDVMIEVVDARLPLASRNHLLAEIRGDKPCLVVLNKADLADPKVTEQWSQQVAQSERTRVYINHTQQQRRRIDIPQLCRELLPRRGIPGKPIRALIAGIPNVGKSTLINHLAGRKIAQTGNEPAVTKHQQRVLVERGFQLLDTPGIMQPSPGSVLAGYRLAASGAIRNTAMDFTDVAYFLIDFLLQRYPGRLAQRFAVEEQSDHAPEVLAHIAQARGCWRGQELDLHRASEIVVHEWRLGQLGRSSLEFPHAETHYRLLPEPEPSEINPNPLDE